MNAVWAWMMRHANPVGYTLVALVAAGMSVGNVAQGEPAWAVLWAASAGLNGHRAWTAAREGGDL